MKVFLILSLVVSSVLSEAPYPPSGYRPPGPQFELPPRTDQPETDVETFSDTVVVPDPNDRQFDNNNLWPTSQQLPTLEPARFRTLANLAKLPLERVTNLEFFQAPVQLLRTEINYPVDRKIPITQTSTFANVNEEKYRVNPFDGGAPKSSAQFLKQPREDTREGFKSSGGKSFNESATGEYETTTINTINKSSRSRVVLRRKTLRASKIRGDLKERGVANNPGDDFEQQQALFIRRPSEVQKTKQRLQVRPGPNGESAQQNVRTIQRVTSFDYDNVNGLPLDDDNNIGSPEGNQNPEDTYGVPAVEVTSSRPRRRKTRRRKITTTTSTTEAPGDIETEESVPENEDSNVAISTAVAGLPPPVYLVHEQESGQLQFLQLGTN